MGKQEYGALVAAEFASRTIGAENVTLLIHALRAGWMTDDERQRLEGFAQALAHFANLGDLVAVDPDSPETIDEADSDEDDDGFHLRIGTDVAEHHFRVRDVPTAKALLSAVSRLRPWIADHDRERAEYDAASPEERAKVISGRRLDDDDPGGAWIVDTP